MEVIFILVGCFTGHRQIASDDLAGLQKRLQKAMKYFIKQGVTDFYAGGALGFDTLAVQAVLKARRFHPQVRLILALPCHDQDARWKEADRRLYASILQKADQVVYFSERYTRSCMFERNRYLVDHSDICICYCASEEGGTAYTVHYAEHKGIPVINLAGDGGSELHSPAPSAFHKVPKDEVWQSCGRTQFTRFLKIQIICSFHMEQGYP